MNPQPHDWSWLQDRQTISALALRQACDISSTDLDELVDYGALIPLEGVNDSRIFSADCMVPLREASKARKDFDLDIFVVVLLLKYLDRIELLERRVQALQARLPGRSNDPRDASRGAV